MMMQDKEHDNQTPDGMQRIIDICEPGHSLSAAEADELQGDEQTLDACRTMFYARVLTDKSGEAFADDEWQRVSRRHMRGNARQKAAGRARFVRISLGAAAACVAAVAVFLLTQKHDASAVSGTGEIALVSSDKIKNVTLQSDEGSSLSLGGKVSSTKLNAFDVKMDASGQLVYTQNAAAAGEDVQMHAISTPRGKDFSFILADGTRVWLNSSSHLEYPSRFDGGERVVRLQGEAYFAVAKDAAHPFVVKSGRMETRVLGTQLNINDYNGRISEVTLVTGVAEVSSNSSNTCTRLRPGQNATVKQDGRITVRAVDTELYTAWKDGYFSFDNITLGDVMRHIADWYGLEVAIDKPAVTHLRLRYYNERNVPVENNIRALNAFGTFRVVLKGHVLHVY